MELEIQNNSNQKIVIKMEGRDYDLSSPILKPELRKMFDLYSLYQSQSKANLKEKANETHNKMFGLITKALKIEGEVEIEFSTQSVLIINLLDPVLYVIKVNSDVSIDQRELLEYYSKESKFDFLLAYSKEFKIPIEEIKNNELLDKLIMLESSKQKLIKDQQFGESAKVQAEIKECLQSYSPFDKSIPVYFQEGNKWCLIYFEIL